MPKGTAAEQANERFLVSAADLGRIFGVGERRIRELRDQGRIPGLPNGRFDLFEAGPAYALLLRPAAGRGSAGGSAAAEGLDEARIRLLTAQAEHREMLNEQMRGEAVLAEDMEVVVGAMVDAARAKVLAMPTKGAPAVVGLTTLPEIRGKMTELAHECCGELAADRVAQAVLDRAKQRAGRTGGGGPDSAEVGAAS
ncbi:hypothetical protein M0638_25110 [Roseomonas sp. NAR14]|uniref:Phage terminase Nu1 subunit (DNA packaging protein) n=1 Tax=Roseomonas acroporae TaxID=2937791 RepID=A0A9X1YKG6_9PROT|nr:hypothetical protein [Roseomonas acroporae]MCK8787651.1 hypothetical protein [Roseomonas acroporae]